MKEYHVERSGSKYYKICDCHGNMVNQLLSKIDAYHKASKLNAELQLQSSLRKAPKKAVKKDDEPSKTVPEV